MINEVSKCATFLDLATSMDAARNQAKRRTSHDLVQPPHAERVVGADLIPDLPLQPGVIEGVEDRALWVHIEIAAPE